MLPFVAKSKLEECISDVTSEGLYGTRTRRDCLVVLWSRAFNTPLLGVASVHCLSLCFMARLQVLLLMLLGGIGAVAACQHVSLNDAPPPTPVAATAVLWSGGVTDTSARVTVRIPSDSAAVQLEVHPAAAPDQARRISGTRSRPFADVHQFHLTGLSPATSYRYAVTVDGVVDSSLTGRTRTVARGPQSFRVALGSCAETGSRHPVFNAIRAARPDLFLHLGDLHYEDIDVPQVGAFGDAYHRVHASPEQAALFRSVPLAYVWDDHDYGPNNSSRQAPGQDAAQQAYRTYVPHYALPADGPSAPIYQAFTVGRVRFLLTDLRSARTPNDAVDVPTRTMMGARQRQWFKDELAAARDRHPLIVWISSVPWIANDPDALDRWSGFPDERRELATYIDSIGVADQLVMASGDAHMVAFDDGTNNHYGLPDGGGFPVVHAGALDRRGSVKGGTYTHRPYPNRSTLFGDNDGQFVVMDVADDGGDAVCATWTGKRHRYDTNTLVDLFRYERCFDVPGARDMAP